MLINSLQTSFAAGEISPRLYGRVDLAKYHVGLALARNVFVDFRGGLCNRPGTRIVGRAISDTYRPLLIPFQYSDIQSYILEFSHLKMRVIRDGGYVLEPSKAFTFASNVYTVTAHGFANGDLVSVPGQTLPGTVTVLSANTFELRNHAAVLMVPVPTSGSLARVFTLTSPYAGADLDELHYSQSFDTITLTHPDYDPRDLTRTQHWVWTFSTLSTGSALTQPGAPTLTGSAAGTTGFGYRVTAILGSDESIPSDPTKIQTVNITSTAGYITIAWSAVTTALKYNVYRTLPVPGTNVLDEASYGYIGSTTGVSFIDPNIIPDFTKTPPQHFNPFALSDFPTVTCYFQQRRVFAGSRLAPQTLWFSKPGLYSNFDVSDPINDGDGLTLTIASTRANNIRALVPMPGGLVVLTSEGAWQISGGSQYSAVKASDAVIHPQSFNGAAPVSPITMNYEVLYVQAKGSTVRSLAYNLYSNTYQTQDLSLLSNHLVTSPIVQWAFAEEPHKLVWALREDGKLLTFTYIKEQDLYAWCHHDTDGFVESVAVVEEGNASVLYMAVRRKIGAAWVRFVEQIQPRDFLRDEDAWFVDCGLDYGLAYPAADITLSGVSGTVVVDASASVFTGAVGKVLRVGGGLGIVTSASATQASVAFTEPLIEIYYSNGVPKARVFASGEWSLTAPVSEVKGLDHLEGMPVSVLADGQDSSMTVTGGKVTLLTPATRIIVGLPFQSQVQLLPIEGKSQSIQGKRKLVRSVTVRYSRGKGAKYGPSFENLRTPVDQLNDIFIPLSQQYDLRSQLCIQQDRPLPLTLLMISLDADVGG